MAELEPVYLSISDIQNFLRCRRKWDFTSVNRQGLKRTYNSVPSLDTGSAVHKGVEGLYATGTLEGALKASKDFFAKEEAERGEYYKKIHGFLPLEAELTGFRESETLAEAMLRQYVGEYSTDPLKDYDLKHIASEVTFKIPLWNYYNVFFVGTWDDLVVDDVDNVYLVERKTFSTPPESRDLQHALQFVGYAWAFHVVTGQPLKGMLYDGIAKRLMTKPKVLKNGSLSTDKQQSITLQMFLDAMQEIGTDPFDPVNGERYQKYIEFLERREDLGDHRFFYREMLRFTEEQVVNFGETLHMIVREMISEDQISIYPNFVAGCKDYGRDCPVKDLCYSMEKGYDIENIKKSRYEVKTYGTMETLQTVEPSEINSIEDLFRAVKDT